MKKSYKNKQQKIIKELFSLNIHKFYKSNLYKKKIIQRYKGYIPRSTKTRYPESIDLRQQVLNKPKKKSKGPRHRLHEQQLGIRSISSQKPQNWSPGCTRRNL